MFDKLIFGMFEARTSCPKCGSPMMINGPVSKILCNMCQSEITIPKRVIRNIIGCFLDDYRSKLKRKKYNREEVTSVTSIIAGYSLFISIAKALPECHWCHAELKNISIKDIQKSREIECKNCHKKNPVMKAPGWIRRVEDYPYIIELFIGCALSEPDGKPEKPAIEGVVFTCPKCGGALDIDGMERIVPCGFCSSKVYLPDDLWLRLHPLKTVQSWYMGFKQKGYFKGGDSSAEENGGDGYVTF